MSIRASFERYQRYLKTAGINIGAEVWIVSSIVIAVIIGALIGTVRPDFGVLLAILILEAMLGVPYYVARKRIDAIERALPDALKQMSTTFKAGGTYEYALKEIANVNYGPLSSEIQRVLNEVKSGASLNDALQSFADRTDSTLIKRTIRILIDASNTGASLSNIFDEIAEDIRSTHSIMRERKAKVLLQVIFMFTAGAIIAPLIFGIVSAILGFMINVSVRTGLQGANIIQNARYAHGVIDFVMITYVFIESLAASAMIASMRDGRFSKMAVYFPAMVIFGYITFNVARGAMMLILGV